MSSHTEVVKYTSERTSKGVTHHIEQQLEEYPNEKGEQKCHYLVVGDGTAKYAYANVASRKQQQAQVTSYDGSMVC